MLRFDRYILSNIFFSTLGVLLFLLVIDFLVQSGEEAANIGEGSYTIAVMGLVLLLQIPQKIIEFTPAAILVGSILSLGQLASQQELTVAQCSGMSRLRIVRSGFVLALALGLALIAIGEFISPSSTNKSQTIRNLALGKTSQNLAQGIWLKDTDNTLISIGELAADGKAKNLYFYRRSGKQGEIISIQQAEQAKFHPQEKNQNSYWQLTHPQQWSISPKQISAEQSNERWQSNISPENLAQISSSKNPETIRELFTLSRFLASNKLNHQKESLRMWQKILLPLSTLTMLLLALPFVFQTSRHSNGARLLVGIVLGTSYYILQGVLSSLALLLSLPAVLGAILPNLVLAIPAVLALKRS